MNSAGKPKKKKEFSLLLEQGPLRKNEGRLTGIPLLTIASISILIFTLILVCAVLSVVTRQEQLRLIATLDATAHLRETYKFERPVATSHYAILVNPATNMSDEQMTTSGSSELKIDPDLKVKFPF
jgi:hypothetical protein